MAMEISRNLFDYAVMKQNYSNDAVRSMAESSTANRSKKKETEKITETVESSKTKKTTDYANGLAKLVPSVDFKVGNVCSSAKSGKSLTVNPKLLEKMQKNPEEEKDMKDMIKGVESMSKLAESIAKATGWTIVYQHSYIDENGQYHCRMQTRNDGMLKLSDKLREERKKKSEELIERMKEKAKEKMAASKDGTIYLDDTDMRTIIEAAREEEAGKTTGKEQVQAGANLDLQI